MMNEVNEEIVCGRKRGRIDTQQDDKPEQQKKNRTTCLPSDLAIFESLELEEDNVCNIDEERIYNLMRELMEEIGIIADPPLSAPFSATLPFQASSETSYASCDSASSSTNCFSTSEHASTEIELAKTVVDRADWGDYNRAKVFGDYNREEDFSEVFGAGSFLINDGCVCNLNKAFSGDEFWQQNDVVSSDMSSNMELCEIENWVLSANSHNEPRR